MSRVSIVIPTYNRAALLQKTLDSALRQTYRDIEVIVIDNASEDETPEVMAGYRERDPRVKYIRKPVNKGMVDSYNMGYRLSAGEFVRFLDSDDLLVPEATALQVDLMDKNPGVDLVYSRYFFIDAQNRKLCLSESPPMGDEEVMRRMLQFNFVQMNSALMRRKVMGMTADGPYDQNVPSGASDWVFLLNLLLNGSRLIGLEQPLLLYRIHPGNHTRNIAGFESDLKTIQAWLYSDPRLPSQYVGFKNVALENQYLWFCSGYYENGDFENGKRALRVAWQMRPDWHDSPEKLIQKLAAHFTSAWILSPLKVLENMQAYPPEEIGWLRQPAIVAKLRAYIELKMALRAIDTDDVNTFQQLIQSAIQNDPDLMRDPSYLIDIIAGFSQHTVSCKPREFFEQLVLALPPEMHGWIKHNRLVGTFLFVDSFAQYTNGNYKQVIADVMGVSRYWPRKTLHRGLLSTFRKSFYSLAKQTIHRGASL